MIVRRARLQSRTLIPRATDRWSIATNPFGNAPSLLWHRSWLGAFATAFASATASASLRLLLNLLLLLLATAAALRCALRRGILAPSAPSCVTTFCATTARRALATLNATSRRALPALAHTALAALLVLAFPTTTGRRALATLSATSLRTLSALSRRDRKSTRLNSSHHRLSRMPSSA